MTLSRTRLTTSYKYFIDDETLQRSIGPIRDLGIVFDPKLKFDCQIHMVVNKMLQLLDFINRNCSDFTDEFNKVD